MNPITNIKSRQRQREQEVLNGIPESAQYHSNFKNSAYIYAGQLSFKLTEGDLLAIFSEYGEVVDVNLVRDKRTGESRGFAFLAYEDQRSTDLAVDNLNGYSVAGRMIAVDHVTDYKRLKDNPDYVDEEAQEAQLAEAHGQPDANGAGPADAREPDAVADGGGAGPSSGGKSLAEMLREAEHFVGDWRSRAHAEQRAAPVHDAEEDPMASFLQQDRKEKRKRHKGDKEKKPKSEKKEKSKAHKHKDRHRHRSEGEQRNNEMSPDPHQRRSLHQAEPSLPRDGFRSDARRDDAHSGRDRHASDKDRRHHREARERSPKSDRSRYDRPGDERRRADASNDRIRYRDDR